MLKFIFFESRCSKQSDADVDVFVVGLVVDIQGSQWNNSHVQFVIVVVLVVVLATVFGLLSIDRTKNIET